MADVPVWSLCWVVVDWLAGGGRVWLVNIRLPVNQLHYAFGESVVSRQIAIDGTHSLNGGGNECIVR